MDKTEREKTTESANSMVISYLAHEPNVAVSISSIYAGIRLRTLLTDFLSPPRHKWNQTSEILNEFDLFKLIGFCKECELLSGKEEKNLQALRIMRNKVAHESRLWKKLEDGEKERIEKLFNFTLEFLERTNTVVACDSKPQFRDKL